MFILSSDWNWREQKPWCSGEDTARGMMDVWSREASMKLVIVDTLFQHIMLDTYSQVTRMIMCSRVNPCRQTNLSLMKRAPVILKSDSNLGLALKFIYFVLMKTREQRANELIANFFFYADSNEIKLDLIKAYRTIKAYRLSKWTVIH